MAWNYDPRKPIPIVKQNSCCFKRSQWKYCPYWMSKTSKESGRSIGFRCSLFNKDKNGDSSLAECDSRYGTTYEGPA